MAIYEFDGYRPVVHPSAFIHPQATIIGDVIIGAKVYIGPGARIRGDWGQIVIEDGCNVQENCIIHMFPGVTVYLREMAHIGHGAIIHGATIGKNTLIGMNAVVMDECVIGEECIVGALAFLPQGMHLPNRSIAVGNPAKIVKQVSDDVLAWKTQGTQLYMELPGEMLQKLTECEPFVTIEKSRKPHPSSYLPKKNTK